MTRLSALLCVHNEEERLPACLAALSFCDEIVVVADRCSDGTEAIARQYGAHVVSGIFPIEGPRKHAGLAHCTGDWILELDADEGVSPAFGQEVRETIERADAADWYQTPIYNYIGDQLVRHGWGGSFGFADPDNDLAVAYAMNFMREPQGGLDPRFAALVGAVYASV